MSEPRAAAKSRPTIPMFRVHVSPESVRRAVQVLESGYIGEGPVVKELEAACEAFSGSPRNVALNSGTSALHLALVLAGVEPGDEVVTTAQTMMATSHAILMQRAVPVFADVQPLTGNLDPADVERRITDRTRAILVVHWAGYPCDMDEIHEVAGRRGLPVIEDAAHATGARYKGRPIGSISPMTCFSFQAIKHVTGGDGGLLTVLDEERFREARRLRWYGIDREQRKPSPLGEPEWDVTRLGFKYHMNDIAAAITLGNLAQLDAMLEHRRKVAARYRSGLGGVPGLTLLESRPDRESAHWLFTLLAERRLDLLRRLQEKGIQASVVHLRIDRNSLYGGERRDLPNLDRFTEAHFSLPIHEGLSDEDVEYVVSTIAEGW